MKITTKTGDKGKTSLFGGARVSKNSFVVEILGELDELQAFLGWCGVADGLRDEKEVREVLDKVQDDLSTMMAAIGSYNENNRKADDKDVLWLEDVMEKYGDAVAALEGFVKPGTSETSSRFHVARAVCRRVERRVVKYFAEEEVSVVGAEVILKYLNRLSDLIFVFAVKFG